MADILIRGMEMPEGDNKISIIIFSNGKVSLAHDKKYAEYAEAVPLPEGHGRLIDGTDLYTLLDGGFYVDLDELPETKDALLCMIQLAETIVPAEGGIEENE